MHRTILVFAILGALVGCRSTVEDDATSEGRLSNEQAPKTKSVSLQQTLDALGAQCGQLSPGTSCGLAVRDLTTGETASYFGSQAVISASSVKAVWVAAALMDTSIDTVSPLVGPVFAHSDNEVSGQVIDLLSSPDRINTFMWNDVGMGQSNYCQWGFGGRPRVASNCNYSLDGNNYFTADDGALFMEVVAKGQLLGEAKTAALLDWMTLSPRSGYGGWLGTQLPEAARATMAHKAGWLPPPGSRITNEIGLVRIPDGHTYAVGLTMKGGNDYDRKQLPMMEYASCVIYHAVAKDLPDAFSGCTNTQGTPIVEVWAETDVRSCASTSCEVVDRVYGGQSYQASCWTTGEVVSAEGYSHDKWVKVRLNGGGYGFISGIYLMGDQTGGVTVECP
jgi:beta-lactamase class A